MASLWTFLVLTLRARTRELTHRRHPRPKHLLAHIHLTSGIMSLPHAPTPVTPCLLLIFNGDSLCFRKTPVQPPKFQNL